MLEAQAQFDGPERKVSVRVAEQDGSIYLDLADEFWRAIEIGAQGWRVAEDVPVRFRRPPGIMALPLPARGGSRVDGALARTFLRCCRLVGCGHVSGLFVRRGWPLALMLSADQVPIHRTHSEMR